MQPIYIWQMAEPEFSALTPGEQRRSPGKLKISPPPPAGASAAEASPRQGTARSKMPKWMLHLSLITYHLALQLLL